MKRIILAICLAFGLIAASAQTSGAVVSNTINWPSGWRIVGSDGDFSSYCSMGPYVKVLPNSGTSLAAGYYMMTARHCVDGNLATPKVRHSSAFWTDYVDSIHYPAGFSQVDVALARIMPYGNTTLERAVYAGIAQAQLTGVLNTCPGGFGFSPCSFASNGGFNNALQRQGYSAPGTVWNGQYLCKTGWTSGVSCGWSGYAGNLHPSQGIASKMWKIDHTQGCGSQGGDSGGPVYQVDSNGFPYLVGFSFARENTLVYTVQPGSGCSSSPDPTYGTRSYFYQISDVVGTFGLTWNVNVVGV